MATSRDAAEGTTTSCGEGATKRATSRDAVEGTVTSCGEGARMMATSRDAAEGTASACDERAARTTGNAHGASEGIASRDGGGIAEATECGRDGAETETRDGESSLSRGRERCFLWGSYDVSETAIDRPSWAGAALRAWGEPSWTSWS